MNLPNRLTMMRVCMIPVIVALMMAGGRARGLIAAAAAAAAISPHARPPAIISATITGIMHTRIIVSRLGRFTRTPPAGRTPPRR